MDKPLISFIVPIYNVAPYLEKCITSVLEQSFRDFEVIAVNDGSTDSCGEILDRLSRQDPRIRVIHKKNEGLCSARNAGIDAAAGTWLYFLDGDDFLLPDSIAKVVPFLEDRYDLVTTVIGSGEPDMEAAGIRAEVSTQSELTEAFDTVGWILFSVCGKFYRTEVLSRNALRFNEQLIANEDQAFSLAWLGLTDRLLALNNQTYHYYQREGSTIHSTRDPRLETGAYAYYLEYLEKNPGIIEGSSLFCNMFVGYAVYKILEGLALDRRTAEMRAIMANPFVVRALTNVTFTQKDKLLVCGCIRKKAVMPLTALFALKHTARRAKPVFNWVKKLTR